MIFHQIGVGEMKNFTYILGDKKGGVGVVVDPSWNLDKIVTAVNQDKLRVQFIVNTHTHFDHVLGNKELASVTGAKIVAHKSSKVEHDISVGDEDMIEAGDLRIKVMHTPGHSPESVCLLCEGKLLTGDTLFVGECGRTDLPGSDSRLMYDSLFKKLMALEDQIEVYPGHDYGTTKSSTIGYERKNNYVLKPRTQDEFVEFMASP